MYPKECLRLNNLPLILGLGLVRKQSASVERGIPVSPASTNAITSRTQESKFLKVPFDRLHVTVVRTCRATLDDVEGICDPVLLALVRCTLMHQIPIEKHQGPFLDFQCLIFILCRPHVGFGTTHTLSPKRSCQVDKFGQPHLGLGQSLSQRCGPMGPGSNVEASILERGVLERIPERRCAGWVREADASVLVRNDLPTNAGEFGNQLTLRDARIAVAKRVRNGAVEGGMRHGAKGRQLVNATT